MTTDLRHLLSQVADQSPPISVAPGLFDRARRARWRRRLAAWFSVAAALGLAGVVPQLATSPRPLVTDDVDQIPASVVVPPTWTADIRDAPLDRALVVLRRDQNRSLLSAPLILVGPDDAYRTFDPPRSWSGSIWLSPDGSMLMTGHGEQAQVLDVTTGRTRMLRAGAPLAWSPDSRQVILVHFDGDENAFPVSGELRVVDVSSGETQWSIPLEPGPLPRSVDAVLSPDGSTAIVQRHGDLYAYRRGHGVVWHRSITVDGLAGQWAWTPDGNSVVINDSGLCLLDAGTGATRGCTNWQRLLWNMSDKVQTVADPEVVGWDGATPIATVGRDIVRLSDPAEIVMRSSAGIRAFAVATTQVDWTTRVPGPPDPGPALDRYRPIISVGGVALVAVIVVILAIRARRRANPGRAPG